jgi:hypothetical protein
MDPAVLTIFVVAILIVAAIATGMVRRRGRTKHEHHSGLPCRRATPPPTRPPWRARHRRQGQAAVDRRRRPFLVRGEQWRRQAVRAGRPGGGHREPAFDHALLAAALAAASGQQVDPEALPFMAIELAGNAVEFDAFGEHWRCRLDSYACELAEFTPPGNSLEVPSPDEKVAVSQRGHDLGARSLADGREWALTTDGEPDYQYGSGPDCTSNGTLLRKFGLPHLPPAVAWSPDSTKVLAHRTDERGVRQTHLVEARPADGGVPVLRTQRYAYPGDENLPQAELVVLDVSEGTVVRAQAEPLLRPQLSPITTKLSPTSGCSSRRSCGCWPTRCRGTRSGTAGATCTGTTCAPASCSGRSPPGSGRCGRSCTSRRPSGWCTSPSPGWLTRIRTGARCAGSVWTAPASPRSPTTSWTTSSPCRTPWSASSTPRPLWTPRQ